MHAFKCQGKKVLVLIDRQASIKNLREIFKAYVVRINYNIIKLQSK